MKVNMIDIIRFFLLFFKLSKKYTDEHSLDKLKFTDDGDGNITISEEE